MENENLALLESELRKTWNRIEHYDCAILTAQRNNLSSNENQIRGYKLKTVLKSRYFDVTRLIGYYNEDIKNEKGELTGEYRSVKEISYFVANQKQAEDFLQFIHTIGNKFDQDSVLYIEKGGNSFLLKNDGTREQLGQFQANTNQAKCALTEAYSKAKGRPYVFKECRYIDNRSLGMNLGVDPCQRYRGKTIAEIVELIDTAQITVE